jgi:hypothetical protein
MGFALVRPTTGRFIAQATQMTANVAMQESGIASSSVDSRRDRVTKTDRRGQTSQLDESGVWRAVANARTRMTTRYDTLA